jgi:lambda repressor-like predicted transcriptional regulator
MWRLAAGVTACHKNGWNLVDAARSGGLADNGMNKPNGRGLT